MPNETDDLYRRLLADWLRDPSTLDNPLLARAFEQAQPNRELADAYDASTRSLEVEREQVGKLRRDMATFRSRAAVRASKLEGEVTHLRAELDNQRRRDEKRIAHLERELAPLPEPHIEKAEAEQLAILGWRKGVA